MSDWISKIRDIENENKLVVTAYTKEDIEYIIETKLSDEEWATVRKNFYKCIDLCEITDLLSSIARDVIKNRS